jgi:hypothetical protein
MPDAIRSVWTTNHRWGHESPMCGMITPLRANASVAAAVALLMMSVHGLAAEGAAGAGQIDRAAMQAVCESSAAVGTDPSGRFQCAVCPSYTDFHGSRKQPFNLQKVLRGHFSNTTSEQLLLGLSGCEDHADGFGGSALLTREGAGWKKAGYFKAFRPSDCLSFKGRDGLERLACRENDMHFGTSESWIEAASFEDNTLHRHHTLPLIIDNMAGLGFPVKGYCYEQEITAFRKLPSEAGFMVVVTQTRGLAPHGENSCGESEIPTEPKQTIALKFRFDGNRFTPAQESKAGLEKIKHFVPGQ